MDVREKEIPGLWKIPGSAGTETGKTGGAIVSQTEEKTNERAEGEAFYRAQDKEKSDRKHNGGECRIKQQRIEQLRETERRLRLDGRTKEGGREVEREEHNKKNNMQT